MFERLLLAAFASAVLVLPAGAQGKWNDMTRTEMALALGSVLGSEEICGLTYKQAAVEAFIDKRVPADDMEFLALLGSMTDGSRIQAEEMRGGQKAAHCRQTSRVAKSYGFID